MTVANYAASLDFVLSVEGGFVDDPRDPGGATNMGITLRTLKTWRHTAVNKAEVKELTKGEAAAIYRALFWNAIHGDALPSGVDLMLFDYAVGSGARRAITQLQMLVGEEIDGAIGPKTLAACAKLNSVTLITELQAERYTFYSSLSTFSTYGLGWTKRLASCTELATKFAQTPAIVSPTNSLRASLLAWIAKELPE